MYSDSYISVLPVDHNYISEIEWLRRTEKSCLALKSSASVANNNMEHVVICHLHETNMPINQNHSRNGYPILAHKRKIMNKLLLEKQWGNLS